jgi:hypothetical protein
MGEKAVGVTIAKAFDGVKVRGTIDSFRQARKRFYYHVTYTDGDEEEMSQRELRDCYLLGLSDEIETQWRKFREAEQGKNEEETNDKSDNDGSDGEGSQYDNLDYNEEVRHKRKERKEKYSRVSKKKRRRCRVSLFPSPGIKLLLRRLTANWTSDKRSGLPLHLSYWTVPQQQCLPSPSQLFLPSPSPAT